MKAKNDILNYPLHHSSKDFLASLKSKEIKELTIEPIEKMKVYPMPSVSKILKETMPEDDKQTLLMWEQKMIKKLGQEGFEKYRQDILSTGQDFHSALENYYKTKELNVKDAQNPFLLNLVDSVQPYLDDFQPLNLECQVVHPDLQYQGYIDAVMYSKKRKQVIVLDWKTSKKTKTTLQSTFDNPLQLAAYAGALNQDERYKYQVEGGCLVICYNDGRKATLLYMGKVHLRLAWKKWLERLNEFNKLNL